MGMKKIYKIFILGCLALMASEVKAQDKKDLFNPVNYAVISQTIAPDARGGGLGDIGAATDPDVNSQYWNPAKYPFTISRAGVSLSFTPWLRSLVNDMNLAYLSGYYRIGDYSAVSASLRYFNMGEVFTSEEGAESGTGMTINPYEMSVDVAYSLMLSEKFSLAAAIRWIYSDMRFDYTEDNSPASAFAADIAAYYQNYVVIGQRECQLGLGLNISNIGSKITFSGKEYGEFLPANMRLGASLMIPIDEYSRITLAADATSIWCLPFRSRKRVRTIQNMKTVCIVSMMIFRASAVSSRVSAMPLAVSRKSWRKSTTDWVPSMYTMISLRSVPVIIMRVRARVTASTSPWVPVSR